MIYLWQFLTNTVPGAVITWLLVVTPAAVIGLLLLDHTRIIIRRIALDFIDLRGRYEAQRNKALLARLSVDQSRVKFASDRHQLLDQLQQTWLVSDTNRENF